MIREKHRIINRQGVSVEVISPSNVITPTKALVGRATKQFNSTLALEHFRRGYFLPSITVDGGYLVHNLIANEYYLTVAMYPEIINGQLASNVSHMVVCNSTLDIMGDDIETADDRGNITKTPQVKVTDLRVYTQAASGDLKLYETGLHPETEYVIFAPGMVIAPLDRVTLKDTVQTIPLKVIHTDYTSYPGVVVLQMKSETRV